jgi:hypothetical protein
VNVVGTNGLSVARDPNQQYARNVRAFIGTKKEKTQKKKRQNESYLESRPASQDPESPTKEVFSMIIYVILPDIFYPTFDSLTTSLFSQVIA